MMYLEVKQFPESQEVMDNPDWFFIADFPFGEEPNRRETILGSSAYARVLSNKDLKELAESYFDMDEEDDSITFGGGDPFDMP